jgi:hypothetical protein
MLEKYECECGSWNKLAASVFHLHCHCDSGVQGTWSIFYTYSRMIDISCKYTCVSMAQIPDERNVNHGYFSYAYCE